MRALRHGWPGPAVGVLFILLTLCSAGRAHPADLRAADRLRLSNDRVTFVPPGGFTPLDAEWLALKYPNAQGPRNAVGNARRTTTIAYDVLDGAVPANDLETLRTLLLTGLSQAPKLRWLANEIRQFGNQDWVYLECTTAAVDQDIHNIVLATVVDNRVVLFNFNSTVEEFGALEKALRASIASITVEPRR